MLQTKQLPELPTAPIPKYWFLFTHKMQQIPCERHHSEQLESTFSLAKCISMYLWKHRKCVWIHLYPSLMLIANPQPKKWRSVKTGQNLTQFSQNWGSKVCKQAFILGRKEPQQINSVLRPLNTSKGPARALFLLTGFIHLDCRDQGALAKHHNQTRAPRQGCRAWGCSRGTAER